MLFSPKKSKYKKYQKGSIQNRVKNNCVLKIYLKKSIKLISKSHGQISAKELIAARFLIKKVLKKKGLVRFLVFPQKFISKKPSEIRMGKGKGNLSHWSVSLKRGSTICEIFLKKKFKKLIVRVLKRVQIRLCLNTKVFVPK
jgi:large subunit ribosomal protein L16